MIDLVKNSEAVLAKPFPVAPASRLPIDLEVVRIAELIKNGDLSKADVRLREYVGGSSGEVAELRAEVRERLLPPYEHFAPVAFQKLRYGDGFARCILHLVRHDQERIRRTGPAVVGIAGPSGAGKSTLIRALIPHLTAQGLDLSEIAVVDQDQFFIPSLASAPFSGHNPQARDWGRLREQHRALIEGPGRDAPLRVIICQSNAAFLDPELLSTYDLRIGLYARPSTLLERRMQLRGSDDPQARTHFLTRTQPDILDYTYPSLAKNADFLVCTDYRPGKVFANRRMTLPERLRDTLVYLLNCDPAGWDAVWTKDSERFTGATSWICGELARFPHPDRSVLEIGCGGSGKDAVFFRDNGFQYTGIDVSAVACEKTLERLGGGLAARLLTGIVEGGSPSDPRRSTVIQGESFDVLRALRRSGAVFGVVHSYSSLHYLPPALLEQALQDIRAICTGYFSLAIKTEADRTFRMGAETLYPNARVYENGKKCDLRFAYSPNGVRRLLEANGFEVLAQTVKEEEFDAAQRGSERYSPFINTIARPLHRA